MDVFEKMFTEKYKTHMNKIKFNVKPIYIPKILNNKK